MSDIRKRVGKKGTTYQVRYPSKSTKSGYAYATFATRKEALAFVESGKARHEDGISDPSIRTVPQAIDRWLEICEKEGTDGNEPVTQFTLKQYKYYAEFMRSYPWEKNCGSASAGYCKIPLMASYELSSTVFSSKKPDLLPDRLK